MPVTLELQIKKQLKLIHVSLGKKMETELKSMREQNEKAIAALDSQRQEDLKSIMAVIKPISDTYNTANKTGKWLMGALLFVSLIIGIITGLMPLLKKFLSVTQ